MAEQLIDVIARVVMMLMYDHAVSGFTISTVLPTRTLTLSFSLCLFRACLGKLIVFS